MSDPNTEARGKIARAIVYAARQAFMINSYGMTWEEIEVNTANILAGCSVPADGKMNCAEAVQATIMERLRVQADTDRYTGPLVEPISPGSPELRVALALVDNYHAQKQRLAQAEKDNAELLRLLQAEREARDMDVIRLERDRDGFRNGAQFWMDSAKAACARVVKLRTVLEDIHATVHPAKWMSVKTALEETK